MRNLADEENLGKKWKESCQENVKNTITPEKMISLIIFIFENCDSINFKNVSHSQPEAAMTTAVGAAE